MREWEELVPGTAAAMFSLIERIVTQGVDDAQASNAVRRDNERRGFIISASIALLCAPLALLAAWLGLPTSLTVAIVVMGIGGPTAATFFSSWIGAQPKE